MPDPTREEIQEACLQIQRSWSPEERNRRLSAKGADPSKAPRFTVPTVHVSDLRSSVTEEFADEMCGWLFLTPKERERQSRSQPFSSEKPQEDLDDEDLEEVSYSVVVVKFGQW